MWKFTYTQSERKQVQAHAVRLKVKTENGKRKTENGKRKTENATYAIANVAILFSLILADKILVNILKKGILVHIANGHIKIAIIDNAHLRNLLDFVEVDKV